MPDTAISYVSSKIADFVADQTRFKAAAAVAATV